MKKYPTKYFKLALALSLKKFISHVGLIIILNHFIEENNLKDTYNTLDNIVLDKKLYKYGTSLVDM